MSYLRSIALSLVLAACASGASAEWTYPPTRTVDASDTYFGKTYNDP